MKTIQDMLAELVVGGMSDAEISRETEIPQPTITRIRNGVHADTKYEYGKRVEALYQRRLPPQHPEARAQ